jgi:pilus assembly protein CpaF
MSTMVTNYNHSDYKNSIHKQLIEEIDLESLSRLDENTARERLSEAIKALITRERMPVSAAERDQLVGEVLQELFGLGPLEPLLADGTVSDILVNGYKNVYVERNGKLERTAVRFDDDAHVMRIIDRIVSRVGRRIDEASPMIDARLTDGSRVNAIIPPLSVEGPILSIRRFGVEPVNEARLLEYKTTTAGILDLLEAAVVGKLNILISGGTGAGKTTLLNVLSGYIPSNERIITIEDAAELQLRQEHIVRLETRPANVEGEGAVRQRELVINALRMRPDRIIVGEVRGEEALDMLQAMNTGHEGSLTTIHANTPRDAISRLETMVSMANLNIPDRAVRQQIASAVDLIVQVSRLPDGSRKIMVVTEVVGMEGPAVTTQDLFVYERHGYDDENRVRGRFKPTGILPKFTERLLGAGVRLEPEVFGEMERYERVRTRVNGADPRNGGAR